LLVNFIKIRETSQTVGPPMFYWTFYGWLPIWGMVLSLLFLSRSGMKNTDNSSNIFGDGGGGGGRNNMTGSRPLIYNDFDVSVTHIEEDEHPYYVMCDDNPNPNPNPNLNPIRIENHRPPAVLTTNRSDSSRCNNGLASDEKPEKARVMFRNSSTTSTTSNLPTTPIDVPEKASISSMVTISSDNVDITGRAMGVTEYRS